MARCCALLIDHRRLLDCGDRRDFAYAIWLISRVMNVNAKITDGTRGSFWPRLQANPARIQAEDPAMSNRSWRAHL
jgi:hypothetical protein